MKFHNLILWSTILLGSILPSDAFAQKMYSTNYQYQADIKIYVVDAEYKADIVVYRTEHKYEAVASENKGIWYFTDKSYEADKKVYFVDHEYQADIKVFFTDRKYKAEWRNYQKKPLLY